MAQRGISTEKVDDLQWLYDILHMHVVVPRILSYIT